MLSFRKDDGDNGHPAQLVVDMLGNPDEENRKLHCAQLESWFQEYVISTGNASCFKKPGFATSLKYVVIRYSLYFISYGSLISLKIILVKHIAINLKVLKHP